MGLRLLAFLTVLFLAAPGFAEILTFPGGDICASAPEGPWLRAPTSTG